MIETNPVLPITALLPPSPTASDPTIHRIARICCPPSCSLRHPALSSIHRIALIHHLHRRLPATPPSTASPMSAACPRPPTFPFSPLFHHHSTSIIALLPPSPATSDPAIYHLTCIHRSPSRSPPSLPLSISLIQSLGRLRPPPSHHQRRLPSPCPANPRPCLPYWPTPPPRPLLRPHLYLLPPQFPIPFSTSDIAMPYGPDL